MPIDYARRLGVLTMLSATRIDYAIDIVNMCIYAYRWLLLPIWSEPPMCLQTNVLAFYRGCWVEPEWCVTTRRVVFLFRIDEK